jgi:hypothetical protein
MHTAGHSRSTASPTQHTFQPLPTDASGACVPLGSIPCSSIASTHRCFGHSMTALGGSGDPAASAAATTTS